MKIIVVGLGVQGNKRAKFAGSDLFCTVDPIIDEADFKDIKDVPLEKYTAVLICVPESKKINLIKFCIKNKTHILIEKPLNLSNTKIYKKLENSANKNNLFCYVAYNHRFEPNLLKIKNYLNFKHIGKLYTCRVFYGNGTSRLVKESDWRDKGNGVISDIGSHVVDLLIFWFKIKNVRFKLIRSLRNENKSPDHAVIASTINNPFFEIEMSLCSWKNEFSVDIIGSKGSLHIQNLCKWGTSSLTYRKRKLPSGVPKEVSFYSNFGDSTWSKEYKFFKRMIKKKQKTSFSNDILIQNILNLKK